MAVTNRAAKLAKLHRVAKKHYQPVKPPADRTVLEHLLYACCLEDSKFEAADEAFARLQQNFFDWNEVRVTTAVELAETMDCLTDPNAAAIRLKKTLHSMFETHYSFDIDILRKENLGKAMQKMAEYKGATSFVVSYTAQNGLSGHSIAIDKSMINLMYTIGVIDDKEAEKEQVPGLERAIAKNKGVEFFALVHQLAVAYSSSPFNNDVRTVLLSIDASAKERFPKRVRKKKVEPVVEVPVVEEPVVEEKVTKAKKGSKTAKAAKTAKSTKGAKTAVAVAKKPTKSSSKGNAKKATPKKKVAKKSPAKKAPARKTSKKKVVAKTVTRKKKATKKAAAKKTPRKSPTKRLAKKKPR